MGKLTLFLILIFMVAPVYADLDPEKYICPDGFGNGTEPASPIVPYEEFKVNCPWNGISGTESCSVEDGDAPYTWELSCGTGEIDKDTGAILEIGNCCNGTVTVTGNSGTKDVMEVRAARGTWVGKYQESSFAPDCRFLNGAIGCTEIVGDTMRVGHVQGYYAVVEGGCDSLPQIICNGESTGAIFVNVSKWECPIE